MMVERVVPSKWYRLAMRGARFALPALLSCWCLLAPTPSIAGDMDFPPTDYTVRSVDGQSVIGHAHFRVTTDAEGLITVRGEYRFLDGEYDNDEATLRPSSDGTLPRLVHSHHAFFHADGSPDRESRTDVAAGTGSCTVYQNGQPQVNSAHLDFPSDTFAGDAVMLPLQRFLRDGGNGSVSFHDFNCIPGPKLLKVTAHARPASPWFYYPGDLTQVDVEPDFGWINVVIAPFLPHLQAWFDPAENWFFVGGQSARYYKGLKYLMVRVHKAEAEIKPAPATAPSDTNGAALPKRRTPHAPLLPNN
jgi:hypothetical protein